MFTSSNWAALRWAAGTVVVLAGAGLSARAQDCNGNGVPDWQDIQNGTSPDCNGNLVPDECDLNEGTSKDCWPVNLPNGRPDECDIDLGEAADCDGDIVPDDCEIRDGTALDCNSNGVPDECDLNGLNLAGELQLLRPTTVGTYDLVDTDVDRDGLVDLVALNYATPGLMILRGLGGGTFGPPLALNEFGAISAAEAADLDGDAWPDLAFLPAGSEQLGVTLNTAGTFGTPSIFPTLGAPSMLALGDFNSDGYTDIAASIWYDYDDRINLDQVAVHFGHGDGEFDSAIAYTVGLSPQGIAAADFDNDGDLDLATCGNLSSDISVLLNDGVGNFAAGGTYAPGALPLFLVAGDLNNDGYADLATTNNNSPENVSVLLNTADGTGAFGPPSHYQGASAGYRVTIAELTGDSTPELLQTEWYISGVQPFVNAGDGTFTAGTVVRLDAHPWMVCARDWTGDGNTDLITANYYNSSLSQFAGNGDATFGPEDQLELGPPPVEYIYRLATADFNSDGRTDVATSNWYSDTVAVLLNNGNGFPDTANGVYRAGASPAGIAAGDINNDGRPDVVVAHYYDGTVAVYRNLGGGALGAPTWYSAPLYCDALRMGDLNGDNRPDLILVSYYAGELVLLRNLGNGNFAAWQTIAPATGAIDVAVADIDLDGDRDLITADYGASGASVLRNQGNGTFAAPESYPGVGNSGSVAVGDLNGDGYPDVVVANGLTARSVTVLFNDQSGALEDARQLASGHGLYGGPLAVVLADSDGDGDRDVLTGNYSRSVSFIRNLGNRKFASQVEFDTGFAAFDLAALDLDGDTDLDVITADYTGGYITDLRNLPVDPAYRDCNDNAIPDGCDIDSGYSRDCNADGIPEECQGLGDLNCDGQLNFGDITPLVLALSDLPRYQQLYPDCPLANRDINCDGAFNFGDITPFVNLLSR